MRNLPVDLQPVETVDVPLPSGSSAALPVCHPTFRRWSGAPVFDYGGKPLLDCDGEACFAELVILRLFAQERMAWRLGRGLRRHSLPANHAQWLVSQVGTHIHPIRQTRAIATDPASRQNHRLF